MTSPPRHNRPRLPAGLRPAPVTITLPSAQPTADAERELRRHAHHDPHHCWGYFPALAHHPGIHTALPACRDFAATLPAITLAGTRYRFSFLRLALASGSQRPAYHLDSDAATALTGDPATLHRRHVGRLLLNLHTTTPRTLHYLDLDVSTTTLTPRGGYIRTTSQTPGTQHAAQTAIPPRAGRTVHGITFLASHVLHSGVDGPHGHYIAAYGYDQPHPEPPS
jgi:hypothetical protein